GAVLGADDDQRPGVAVAGVVAVVEEQLGGGDVVDEVRIVAGGEALAADALLELALLHRPALAGLGVPGVKPAVPEFGGVHGGAGAVASEVETQDAVTLVVKGLGEFVPAVLVTVAADPVQQQHGGLVLPLGAGVEGALDGNAVHGVERHLAKLVRRAGA